MNDLRDHFQQIAGPVPTTTTDQVQADLTRGRRALRRRRVVQACTGSAFGVAALAAAIAIATSSTGAAPASDQDTVTASVQLVAYKGEQPKGFTVDKVPDGWFVQSSEQGYLTVAPDKAKNPGPDVNPSKAPVYDKDSFVDKIVIMLESKDQNGPSREGKKVQVGDQEGVLLKSLPAVNPDGSERPSAGGDTGRELWLKQPSGIWLIVQVWEGIGITDSQIVELGAGVHVHKDAVQGVG